MRNHNILRHHSQHLTQTSKVKVTEPKTAKNVIFDGRCSAGALGEGGTSWESEGGLPLC